MPLPALPIVAAPMAGGVSTPELCVAVAGEGALGFLAAGYLTPENLAADIAATQELAASFGVNLFTPNPHDPPFDHPAWSDYRNELIARSGYSEYLFPDSPVHSDDHFAAKLEIVRDARVPVVSFTFGHPSDKAIRALHEVGTRVAISATSRRGIDTASASPADWLIVQGIEAGGHQGTVLGSDDPTERSSTLDLVRYAASRTSKPILAAGGVGLPDDVAHLLRAGAAAAQVGTRFLTAHEAATKPTYRAALLELDRPTMLTRAFSGKWARTIENDFSRTFSPIAPPLYPEINYLTGPMRGAANKAGDFESINLWAGTAYPHCKEQSAAEVVRELMDH